MQLLFLLVVRAVFAYLIAWGVGSKRTIGKTWSFWLCFIIGLIGVVITLFSDKIDKNKFEEIKN